MQAGFLQLRVATHHVEIGAHVVDVVFQDLARDRLSPSDSGHARVPPATAMWMLEAGLAGSRSRLAAFVRCEPWANPRAMVHPFALGRSKDSIASRARVARSPLRHTDRFGARAQVLILS